MNFLNQRHMKHLKKSEYEISYKPISQYPFVLRDIAVFVPSDVLEGIVQDIIITKGGGLLVATKLFDVYKKDEKISYAFQLVFQSNEKTLSDEEINKIMEQITTALDVHDGWKVR